MPKRIFTTNVIKVKKPYSIKTEIGPVKFKPGQVLWRGKNNGKVWEVAEEGFVIRHMHGYNQHDFVPWECIKLVTMKHERCIVTKSKAVCEWSKNDFYKDKK